jgi:hypothetical protein
MKTIFLYALLISNILLSPLMASEYSKEELEYQILETHKDFVRLLTMTFPSTTNPSTLPTGQEDLSITESILLSLLDDYTILTGEHFILPTTPTVSSAQEMTFHTPPIDTLPINTPIYYNEFRIIYVGKNKGAISIESLLNEAQQNSLLPVQFVDPDKNLCQLELVRPNKTEKKPAEQNLET